MRAYTSGETIPMTPDHSVQWQAYPVGSDRLLLNPESEHAAAVADQLVHMSGKSYESSVFFRYLDKGRQGTAYKTLLNDHEIVAKVFHGVNAFDAETTSGLRGLQASVTLGAGLDRITKREAPRTRLVMPTMHGALLSERHPTVWMQDVAPGYKVTSDIELEAATGMGYIDRYSRYLAGLVSVGADIRTIKLDDGPNNLFVRLPLSPGECVQVTKIDVYATNTFKI